jgi:hypothetical protein
MLEWWYQAQLWFGVVAGLLLVVMVLWYLAVSIQINYGSAQIIVDLVLA